MIYWFHIYIIIIFVAWINVELQLENNISSGYVSFPQSFKLDKYNTK